MTWKCCFFVSGFIFECKPKRTFYENSVCVNNICCWKCVALKKSKSLSFFSWETFLKSECVKGNHENMKSHDGILCHHGSKNEGMCFFSKFFKGKFSEKKIARLLNEKSSSNFEAFWKTSASESGKVKHELRVTSSHPRVTSSNTPVKSSNPRVTSPSLRVMSSNLRVTSSNLSVRRRKARAAKLKLQFRGLKTRAVRLKTRVRGLKARVDPIKPRVI